MALIRCSDSGRWVGALAGSLVGGSRANARVWRPALLQPHGISLALKLLRLRLRPRPAPSCVRGGCEKSVLAAGIQPALHAVHGRKLLPRAKSAS